MHTYDFSGCDPTSENEENMPIHVDEKTRIEHLKEVLSVWQGCNIVLC